MYKYERFDSTCTMSENLSIAIAGKMQHFAGISYYHNTGGFHSKPISALVYIFARDQSRYPKSKNIKKRSIKILPYSTAFVNMNIS